MYDLKMFCLRVTFVFILLLINTKMFLMTVVFMVRKRMKKAI